MLLGEIELRPLLRLRRSVGPILLLHGLTSSVHALSRLRSPVRHLIGDRQVPGLLHCWQASGLPRRWRWGRGHLGFQVFDPLVEIWVHTPVSRGVGVAGKGIVWLRLGLVEDPEVCPRGPMVLVKLNCADVGLQSIHRLVLLLVKHSN